MGNFVLRYIFGFLYWVFQVKKPELKTPVEDTPQPVSTPTTTGVVKYENEIVATIRTYQETINHETLSDDVMDRRLLGYIPSVFASLEDMVESLTLVIRTFDLKVSSIDERLYLDFENVTLRTRAIAPRNWANFLVFRGSMKSIRTSFLILDQFVEMMLVRYHAVLIHPKITVGEKLYYGKQINMLLLAVVETYKFISENGNAE